MTRFLLASGLALGLAAGASAQSNTATVNQAGTANASNVSQAGGSTATVTQDGNNNTVGGLAGGAFTQSGASRLTVVQGFNPFDGTDNTGSSNASVHGQQSGGSTATVRQQSYNGNLGTGSPSAADGNSTRLNQADGGDATILQSQVVNSASTINAGNTVDLTQAGGTNNNTFIFQSGGDGMDATVSQTGGDGNSVSSQQAGSNMELDIAQTGNRNKATSYTGFSDAVGYTELTIDQTGDDNQVGIEQRSNDPRGGTSVANITQIGTFNQVGEAMSGPFAFQQSSSVLQVSQMGSGDYVGGSQVYSTASVTQNGTDGSGLRTSNETILNQDGAVGIAGFAGGYGALVSQSGDGNRANIFQNGNSAAMVTQTSDGNTANVSQAGTSNTATVTQN